MAFTLPALLHIAKYKHACCKRWTFKIASWTFFSSSSGMFSDLVPYLGVLPHYVNVSCFEIIINNLNICCEIFLCTFSGIVRYILCKPWSKPEAYWFCAFSKRNFLWLWQYDFHQNYRSENSFGRDGGGRRVCFLQYRPLLRQIITLKKCGIKWDMYQWWRCVDRQMATWPRFCPDDCDWFSQVRSKYITSKNN